MDTENHPCHQASELAQRVAGIVEDVQVQGKGLLIQVGGDLRPHNVDFEIHEVNLQSWFCVGAV